MCASRRSEFVHEQLAVRGGQRYNKMVVGRESVGGAFGHGYYQRIVGSPRNFRVDLFRGSQRRVDVPGNDFFNGAGFKWDMTGQSMIECPSKAVHVGQEILALAFDFF